MKNQGEQELSGQAVEPPIAGLADRELDAAVAERVMEWQRGRNSQTPGRVIWFNTNDDRLEVAIGDSGWIGCWRPSRDIAAAMEVVEKMRNDGWSFACTLYEGKLPYASFCKRTAASSRNAEASTLPEAICRAALAAKGI